MESSLPISDKYPAGLLVVEAQRDSICPDSSELAARFGLPAAIRLTLRGGKNAVVEPIPENRAEPVSYALEEFYADLFQRRDAPDYIYRMRNPALPLPDFLIQDMDAALPPDKFDYALSEGEAFGLEKFFVERISSKALQLLQANDDLPLLPNGCFNGLTLPAGRKYWFSERTQKFFLVDNFDSLFPSPRSVAVNAVSGCNYHCGKCPFHAPDSKKFPARFISEGQFAALLEKCADFKRLSSIAPTLTGEPLLHPDLPRLAELATNAGYNFSFTTNAALLTRQMTEKLLEAKVGPLAFSVDAVSQETYQKLQGGNLEEVENNILFFQEMFRQKYDYFAGTMSFVVSGENALEMETYKRRWLERGFHVAFYARHDWRGNMRPYKTWLKAAPRRSPCLASWHTLFLDENMRPVTCSLGSRKVPRNISPLPFGKSDAATVWRNNPALVMYAGTGRKISPWCESCTCWAEMRQNMLRLNKKQIMLEGLGSSIWLPAN